MCKDKESDMFCFLGKGMVGQETHKPPKERGHKPFTLKSYLTQLNLLYGGISMTCHESTL